MAHMVEKMLYVGATPWHHLGIKLDAPPSVKEALRLAGLNWRVFLVQLAIPGGELVDRWAVVRESDNRVLGTVGPGYRPVQNEAMDPFFTPFIESGAATIETAGSLKNGARVWMLAKIARPDSVIVPQADDRVAKYLLLANGHDGSLAVHVGLTPIRVVCNNTLTAAINGASATVRIRHTGGAANALKAVQDTINRADADFEKAADVYRALAGKYVTEAQIRAYVDQVFPAPKKAPQVTRAAEIAAEWDDGPTSPDIAAPDLLGSLLARPATFSTKSDIEACSEAAAKAVDPRRIQDNIIEIFEQGGQRGDLNLDGVKGTAWAAYNAVTEYLTWHRGGSADNRLNTVWFNTNGAPKRALTAAASTFLG